MRLLGPAGRAPCGVGGAEERPSTMKPSADSPCAQNILKRVEERSEREGTALDAHKELELVSRASSLRVSQ